MKLYRFQLIILLIVIIFNCSCGHKIIKEQSAVSPITSVITAVYKNCEALTNGEIKLVFRRMDNLEYIIFQTDTAKMLSTGYQLITSEEGTIAANNDFLNLKFDITYSEEPVSNTSTSEKILINRLHNLKRSKSDRFILAGIENDTEVDDFIISLKEKIKINDSDGISKFISYPLTVTIKNKKVKIKGPDLFINNYKQIFNKKVTDAVINQYPSELKVNQKGVIIGKENLLINIISGRLLITAINN